MKTPSDELFSLIKSLTPSEKRYFRVEIVARDKGADAAYYRLFDAIDSQEEYNEAELLRTYANEKFARHFAMAKKYLFESLLRALAIYNKSNNTHYDIQEKLVFSGILQSRGMHAAAQKLLKAAKKMAYEREAYIMLFQVLRYELGNRISHEAHEDTIAKLRSELAHTIEIMQLESEYVYLQEASLSILYKSTTASRTGEALDEFMQHPLLQEDNRPQAHSLRVRYHSIISRVSFIRGEYEKAFLHSKLSVEAMEQLPHQIRENPMVYLPQLHNFFNRSLKVGRYDELATILDKVRAVPAGSPQVQRFMYESFYSLQLNYYALVHDYDKAYSLLPAIDKADAVWCNRARTEHRFALLFSSMTVCIYVGDYRRALGYVNTLLDLPPTMPRPHNLARLLSVLIHSELHNSDILDAAVRSVQRHLKKHEQLFHVEEIVLRYLHKLGAVTDRKMRHTLIEQTYNELQEAVTDPFEARTLEYFDFILWFEAKFQDKSINDYLKAKRAVTSASATPVSQPASSNSLQ